MKRSGFFFLIILACLTHAKAQRASEKKQSTMKTSADTVLQHNRKLANESLIRAKESVPDSLTGIKRLKKSDLPKIDSVGVSYENGKLVLPNHVPGAAKKEKLLEPGFSEKIVPELPEGTIPSYENSLEIKRQIKETGVPSLKSSKANISKGKDSLDNLSGKVDGLVKQIRPGELNPERVYSTKSLKQLYDSLGVSKLDTIMALASGKNEVTKDELLKAINASFPSSPDDPENKIKEEGAKELRSLKDSPDLKDELPTPDLSKLKLPGEDLKELVPMRGFQLPTDSIPLLDSLRNIDLEKANLNLNERTITDNVKGAVVENKPDFWDKVYFEGIVSFWKDKDFNSFQASPSLGYRIADNFSVGFGPNILIDQELKKWNFTIGYRAFIKYEIFSQRGYLQVEDQAGPKTVDREYRKDSRHSILAGAGYLQPVSKQLALNLCMMYRVNNKQYSGGDASPWVIRLGISSTSSRKKDSK
jgi:hypothetical protein